MANRALWEPLEPALTGYLLPDSCVKSERWRSHPRVLSQGSIAARCAEGKLPPLGATGESKRADPWKNNIEIKPMSMQTAASHNKPRGLMVCALNLRRDEKSQIFVSAPEAAVKEAIFMAHCRLTSFPRAFALDPALRDQSFQRPRQIKHRAGTVPKPRSA